MQLLADLDARGLLHQATHPDLDRRLEAMARQGSISAYAGFDPTADSLHVGHLVAILALVHAQRHGIRPIALVGGATGLIGDPSGKTDERPLLSRAQAGANAEGIRDVLGRFLDFDHPTAPALVLNNLDWFGPMSAIDFLRDVGRHFRVGTMLGKESVRARMGDGAQGEAGISYTEFSYQILQAYDFHRLYRDHGCVLQLGGSDQWGNLTAGVELIRKLEGESRPVFGLTLPLITTASGAKFGKSEGNAVWLGPQRTTPYDFYQYWIRVADADVGRYLRLFTFLPLDEITAVEEASAAAPERRVAQQRLAACMTELVHGTDALERARSATQILYGGAIGEGIDDATLASVFAEAPTVPLSRERLAGGWPALEALVDSGLAASRAAARRLVEQGGFYVNNRQRRDIDQPITTEDLITPTAIVLRGGKRHYRLVEVREEG